jgi:hypothetical protein
VATDDFWEYALCAPRLSTFAPLPAGQASRCARHARTWVGALATRCHSAEYERLVVLEDLTARLSADHLFWRAILPSWPADHESYGRYRLPLPAHCR